MRAPNQNSEGSALGRLLITSAIGYGLYVTWPIVSGVNSEEWQLYAWGGGALVAGLGVASALRDVAALTQNVHRTFRAMRPKLSNASASWLTKRQARKAGLAKTAGLFLGIVDGQPLFLSDGVHGLICAPARKGKTTCFVMPAIIHDFGASKIVADMKGDLAAQTSELIAARPDQDVTILNPAHKFDLGNATYNPMQIVLDDLEHAKEDVISDAWSMAMQLVPQAPGGDRDPFWPNGTRKMLVFVIVALCVLFDEIEANLPRAFELLGDNDEFEKLLQQARGNDVLAGELSKLASNITSTWDDNPKHFESFREGAVQSLTAFGPSGRLAPSMTHCDFRFRDLKSRTCTLFMAVTTPAWMSLPHG